MARLPVPGPVVIPGVAEVKQHWREGTQNTSIVLHGFHGGTTAVNAALADTLFTSFKNALTTSGLGGHLHAETAITGVEVKDLSAAGNASYLSTGLEQVGTGAAGPLGSQVAIVVTKRSAKSGREFRGRMYIGGLDNTATTDGKLATTGASQTSAAFGEACRTAMSSAGVPMCIANRALQAGTTASGAALPPRSATHTDVTQCVVDNPRLDTQRRRLGR